MGMILLFNVIFFIAALTWSSTQLFHVKLLVYRGQSDKFALCAFCFPYHCLVYYHQCCCCSI